MQCRVQGTCLDIFWVAIIMQGCQVCCQRTCRFVSGQWGSLEQCIKSESRVQAFFNQVRLADRYPLPSRHWGPLSAALDVVEVAAALSRVILT